MRSRAYRIMAITRPALRDKAEIMFCVYILKSVKSGRRYIGYTADLSKRICEHNEGLNISTKKRGPWKLIYKEEGFQTRTEALSREQQIKNMKGGIQLKKLLKSYNARIV